MPGMSKSVPDTRISKPRLRCFVCCLLGSINTRTYRASSGCATQRAREVLDMGSAVIADEVEAAVKSPSSKMKAVSPERQELREAWKPPQPA